MQDRQKLAAGLPPFEEMVRGSLVTRFRRCGKPNCHCVETVSGGEEMGQSGGPRGAMPPRQGGAPGASERVISTEHQIP